MRTFAHAAIAALLFVPTVTCQVPIDIQNTRTDALVIVLNDQTGDPVAEAAVTFFIPVGNLTHTVYTDRLGVAYCGDRESEFSVFEFGRDMISFTVSHPFFVTHRTCVMLPAVEGNCTHVTKSCQTFAVRLGGGGTTSASWPPPVVTTNPLCEYREVFVRAYTALCEDSTANYASVFITHGVCASPIDWSNTTSQTRRFEASFSSTLTAEANGAITKVLGGRMAITTNAAGEAEWTYNSTVVFQGKLGVNPVNAALCGHACMNAAQKVIVTQKQKRCCIQPGALWGCNQWGAWGNDGPPTETRVNTGYCTTEAALYPCANPPVPLPGCAK